MKPKWSGIAAVVAIAVAIVAYKSKGPSSHEAPKAEPAGAASVVASEPAAASVVLVADLAEANDPCVCGKIIRSVRAVAARGIATKEIDPEESPEAAAKYKARVAPAVLILDGSGNEIRRFEGESKETLTALQTELDRLPAKSP